MDKKGFVLRVLATLAALGVIAAMCVAVGSVSLSRAENEDWREIARTRNSKVFQLYEQGKPGPYTRHEYSVGDMHYWDGESWQDPDFGATVNEGEVRFDKLPVGVIFSEGGAISYNYFAKDATLMIWPKVGNTSVSPEFADSTVRYPCLWPGVGLALRPTGSGTKATLLFDQPGHPTSFEFVLTSNLEVVQNGNRIELRDENGEAVLLIRPPFVVLDEINRRVGEVKLNDNIVTLSLPDLTGLSYPLEVDPTIQVGASLDDAYDNKAAGGSFYDDDWIVVGMGKSNTGPSDPSYAYVGGFRFQSVSVAHGATIETAKLQINHYNVKTNIVYLKVYGHDVDDSAAFSDATGENGRPSARTKTTAGVDWDPPSWYTNTWYDSPEIKTVVQEIVDRGSWASGNDMTILVADDGSAAKQNRVPKSYDTSSTYAAKLVITVNSPPDAPTSLLCEGQTNPTGVTDPTPEFSAIVTDPNDGDIIAHTEVEVGTTAGGNDMWDSGWIDITDFTEGNRCSDISYAGATLEPETTYYWRIRFKDTDGGEGSWSGNAQFTTKVAYYLDPSSTSVTQGNAYTFHVKGAHLGAFDAYDISLGVDPDVATVNNIWDSGWLNNASEAGKDIDNTAGTTDFAAYSTGTDVSGSGTLATFTVTAQSTGTFTPKFLDVHTSAGHASDFVRCPGNLVYDNSCGESPPYTQECNDIVDVDDVMRVAHRWNNDCNDATCDWPNCSNPDALYDPQADYDEDCDIDIVDIMKVTTEWDEVDTQITITLGDYYDPNGEQGYDDAYHVNEDAATNIHSSDDLYLGKDNSGQEYFAGLIFRNIPLEYGSVISDARLRLEVASLVNGPITVEVFSEDVVGHKGLPASERIKHFQEDGSGYTIAERLVDKYPGTGGYCYQASDADEDYCGLWVEWTIDSTGTATSPNLAIIIQEAIGRADWDKGDGVSILIRPDPGLASNKYGTVRAYDYGDPDGDHAPVLEIEWVENTYSGPGSLNPGGRLRVGGGFTTDAFTETYDYGAGTFGAWGNLDSWFDNHEGEQLDYVTKVMNNGQAMGVHETTVGLEPGAVVTDAYNLAQTTIQERPHATILEVDPSNESDGFTNAISPTMLSQCKSWDGYSFAGTYNSNTHEYTYDCDTDGVRDVLEYVDWVAKGFIGVKAADPSLGVTSLRITLDDGRGGSQYYWYDPDFVLKAMRYGLGSFFDIADMHYYEDPSCWATIADKYDGTMENSSTEYCDSVPPAGTYAYGLRRALSLFSTLYHNLPPGMSG